MASWFVLLYLTRYLHSKFPQPPIENAGPEQNVATQRSARDRHFARKGPRSRPWRLLPIVLLLIGVALLMWSASTQAGTYDEVTFLGVGRYLWHTRDFDIQHARFHPPLMYYVNSVFLELGPGRWDLGLDERGHFTYFAGRGYLYHSGLHPDAVLLLARYPFVLLFILLGAVLYRWARDVHGSGAAHLTLALYVLSPTVLAHASIAGNDFLLTVNYTLTLFALWEATRHGGLWRWALVGILSGLTMLTKATGIVLWVLVPALTFWTWWLARKGIWPHPLSLGKLLSRLLLGGALALLTLVVGYGFHAIPAMTPETRPHRVIDALVGWLGPTVKHKVYTWAERPIPGYRYVTMLKRQFGHVTGGHEAYLLGEHYTDGRWYFFPVAMSIKTPLGTLVLWVGGFARALWSAIRGLSKRQWRAVNWVVWWGLPVLVILIPAMLGSANMGVRLILPVYPFLFLMAGSVLASPLARTRLAVLPWLLVLLTAISVVSQAPNYLSYVNEAWGGPGRGWRYVGDSNYDWGQSLKALRAYLEARGWEDEEIYLAYFGGELPSARGIRYKPAPCSPVKGIVVVSVTYLQGLYLDDPGCYMWLRDKEPVARVGHTLWVYDLR